MTIKLRIPDECVIYKSSLQVPIKWDREFLIARWHFVFLVDSCQLLLMVDEQKKLVANFKLGKKWRIVLNRLREDETRNLKHHLLLWPEGCKTSAPKGILEVPICGRAVSLDQCPGLDHPFMLADMTGGTTRVFSANNKEAVGTWCDKLQKCFHEHIYDMPDVSSSICPMLEQTAHSATTDKASQDETSTGSAKSSVATAVGGTDRRSWIEGGTDQCPIIQVYLVLN